MKQTRDLGKEKKLDIARHSGDHDYKPLYEKMAGGRTVIDHKRIAHLFIKLIVSSGAHPLIQKIMSLRLLGAAPRYHPMSITGVALALGLRRHDVKRFEREGLDHVIEYFKKVSLEEARNKFNQNSRGQRDLATIVSAEPLKEASKKEE